MPSCFSYENAAHQVLFSEKRNWGGNRVDGRSEGGEDMYTELAHIASEVLLRSSDGDVRASLVAQW